MLGLWRQKELVGIPAPIFMALWGQARHWASCCLLPSSKLGANKHPCLSQRIIYKHTYIIIHIYTYTPSIYTHGLNEIMHASCLGQ